MRTRLTVAGISVAVVAGLAVAGGVALASEDNPNRGGSPAPAVSASTDDKGGLRGTSDDGPGHDVGDDHGGLVAATPRVDDHGGRAAATPRPEDNDDPADDDADDDNGGLRRAGGSDDRAGHDAGDDKGGQRSKR
jgi:hypothetical protein